MFISIFSVGAEGFAGVDVDCDGEFDGMPCIPGMDMSIFSGEAVGFADGVEVDDGICIPVMPGIFMSIFLTGAFLDRDDARDEEGMFMPFILIPLIPPLFCVRLLLLIIDLDLDLGLLLDLPPMFMPGMSCMSCCAQAGRAATMRSRKAAAMAQTRERKFDLKLFMIPS
jgi:hypothetical protein